MQPKLIGPRIKALREAKNLTQDELAEMFGFKDRQTVSAIENGMRRVTSDELLVAIRKLGEPLNYFVDPYRLVNEGRFSWRKERVDDQRLAAYEYKAGCWIAAYRTLAKQVGCDLLIPHRSLGLSASSTHEDAMLAGERIAGEFGLGDVPALQLGAVMEQEFGILVLMVDAEEGVSGAACRLPELATVLIARHKTAGKRYFTLAHEFFHHLTWDAMPPKYLESDREMAGNRAEQLADVFAAAVLMPKAMLEPFGPWAKLNKSELASRLNAVAPELHVTPGALMWRLVSLGELKRSTARALVSDVSRDGTPDAGTVESPPLLFSKQYMKVIGQGIRRGYVSVRFLAKLFDLAIDDFSDLFVAHGMKSPIGI